MRWDRWRKAARELLDPDSLGAVEHRERDDLVGGGVEVAHEGQREFAQPALGHPLAELEHAQAEADAAGDALEAAPVEQRSDGAVDGGERQAGAARELAQGHRLAVDRVEHREHVPLSGTHTAQSRESRVRLAR